MAKGRSAGSARIAGAIVVAALAVALILPGIFGRRAENTYRDALEQLTRSSALRLDSYQRGWFSSHATLSFQFGARPVTIAQIVRHGPLVIYNGWHLAAPVAAVVETDSGAAAAALNRMLGEAPLRISTLVALNGDLDTVVARPESAHDDPMTGAHVSVGAAHLEWRRAQGFNQMTGDIPTLWLRAHLGTIELTGITFGGSSRETLPLLPVGDSEFRVARIACNGSGPLPSFALEDLAFNYALSLPDGMFSVREKFSVGQFTNRTHKLGPIALTAEVGHIAPQPIEDYVRESRAIAQSPSPDVKAMQHAVVDLLMQVVRQAPVLTLGFEMRAAEGTMAGQARMGVDPALANDPQITSPGPDAHAVGAYARDRYGWFSGQLSAPSAMVAQLVDADRLRQLENCHYLVREGGKEVARMNFKHGDLTLNGVKLELPTPAAPASRLGPPAMYAP